MANVQGKFYTSETQRRGVTPSSPPNAEDDPKDPISPSSPVSFITLTDTPSSYSGQTLKGVRVNATETGLEFYTITSGGLPPIDGSYASQALMIADQANQTAQYIYFDGTEYWEYLGTTTPSIADYRAISAGGSSNWTVVGSDIYRNSDVAIGRTTIPTDTTFCVQSRASAAVESVFRGLNFAGTNLFNFYNDGTTEMIGHSFRVGNPSLAAGSGATFKGNDSASNVIFRVDNSSNTQLFRIYGDGTVEFTNKSLRVGSPSSPTGTGMTLKGTSNTTGVVFRVDNSSNVAVLSVLGNGTLLLSDSSNSNFQFGTTTGTKIGTATTQKLSFWNKTPIIQPTNAITASAFVANSSGIANDTATYGGYTMGQIAAALINTGILA